MFTSKDSFKLFQKVSDVRSYFQLFKQNIIKHLDQIETQIETIIFEHYQRDTFDQIYENIIQNSDDTIITDDEFSSIINTWNKVCYMQNNIYQCRFNDKLVERIKNTLTNWEKIAKETFQIDQSIIPRFYNKSFEFIEEYKFQSIKIQNYNQSIEQTQSQTHYCFALVGEKLDWIETNTIRFRFPKFVGDIGVGVCDLNILKQKNFRPQLNQTGNGAFVCFQDSYTINTEQEDLNWKTRGFRYGEPDVIEVEFEPTARKVTWKKVNKPNEGYSVTLQQNRYDLYFCVIVKTSGAKVEISDD